MELVGWVILWSDFGIVCLVIYRFCFFFIFWIVTNCSVNRLIQYITQNISIARNVWKMYFLFTQKVQIWIILNLIYTRANVTQYKKGLLTWSINWKLIIFACVLLSKLVWIYVKYLNGQLRYFNSKEIFLPCKVCWMRYKTHAMVC